LIILDTNVLSELSKPTPNSVVIAWLDRQIDDAVFVTSISIAEIEEGLALLPAGKRKELLTQSVRQSIAELANSVLPFDAAAGRKFAQLVVRAKARRYTLPITDGYIAAIAAELGYAVATRDVAPFLAAGVPVINPWEEK
jgi:predicted nucleic acid-binding protein